MSAAAEIGSSALDRLKAEVAEGEPAQRGAILLRGLADAIKATSNDQNVQRLARELRAASGSLEAALAGG